MEKNGKDKWIKDLLSRRIIYVKNEEDPKIKNQISHSLANYLIEVIEKMNSVSDRPIYLLLESDGGSFKAGKRIRSAVLNSKAKIIGVAIGDIMSAASHVFEACHERWIVDGVHIFLHPMWVNAQVNVKITPEIRLSDVTSEVSDFVKKQREKMRISQREVYSDYANRIGSKMSPIQIKRIFLAKRALSANSAVNLFLADKKIEKFNFKKPEQSV